MHNKLGPFTIYITYKTYQKFCCKFRPCDKTQIQTRNAPSNLRKTNLMSKLALPQSFWRHERLSSAYRTPAIDQLSSSHWQLNFYPIFDLELASNQKLKIQQGLDIIDENKIASIAIIGQRAIVELEKTAQRQFIDAICVPNQRINDIFNTDE